MKNWKSMFRSHILDRGYDYYESGAVNRISPTAKGYLASVGGTEDYEVEIELQGEEISDLWCSCPYAEDGNYCKHMAAVLYELQEAAHETKTGDRTWQEKLFESKRELKEVIEKIPENELRNVLEQLANESESLRNHILIKYSSSVSEKQMISLKKEIDSIAYHYSDRGGFVDWRNAGCYITAMEEFLYNNVQAMIDKGCYMQAFELTNLVFVTIGNQDIDDSDGGTTMAANTCYEFWKQILEKCNESDKKRMFRWFEKHQADGIVIDFMEDYISDFLMNEFQDRELLEQKLRMLDELIEKAGEKTDCGKWYSVHYGYENNILKRLEIMKKLGHSQEEIQKYKEKNRRFSVVRRLEFDEFIEKGETAEAIRTLNESKVLDKEYPGLVKEYSAKLIELYDVMKMNDEYKEELIFQVFSCRQDTLEYANKLKSVCEPREWEVHRENILSGKTGLQIRFSLMEAEGMYERLLNEIAAENSIFSLDHYEKVLKKEFPERVRDIYDAYVRRQADVVSDRKRYKELMKYLKKIKSYPQGKEAAGKIANEWRAIYYRRPAMMDELRKAGF